MSFFLSVLIVGGGAFLWARSAESGGLMDSLNTSIASLPLGNQPHHAEAKRDEVRILIAGVGGEGHPGSFLTDTLMLVEIDNKNESINFISIPRDLLVYTEDGYYRKINSVYTTAYDKHQNQHRALGRLKREVQEITGLSINHYARVNFQGFKELINTLGGVTVDVKETINDPYYPDGNRGYDPFSIEKGEHTLQGERALKYARTRYTSDQGDFDRALRQQQVLKQIRHKLSDLHGVWDANKILNLARTAKQNLKTDLSLNTIQRLYKVYSQMDGYDTNSFVIGRNPDQSALKQDKRTFGGERGFVLVPRAGEENYWEIHEKIQHMDKLNAYERRRNGVKNEQATVSMYSSLSEDDTEKLQSLFDSYGMNVTLEGDVPSQLHTNENYLYAASQNTNSVPNTRAYLKERFDISSLLQKREKEPSENEDVGPELGTLERRQQSTRSVSSESTHNPRVPSAHAEGAEEIMLYINRNPFQR